MKNNNEEIYLHLDNGGLSVEITESSINDTVYGPKLKIKTTHFGSITNTIDIFTTQESLRALSEYIHQRSLDLDHVPNFPHNFEVTGLNDEAMICNEDSGENFEDSSDQEDMNLSFPERIKHAFNVLRGK